MSISVNYNCPEFDVPSHLNVNYLMVCLKRWMLKEGIEDEFKKCMVKSEPWSKDICCVGKICLTLVVSDGDDGLLVNSSAYITVNFLDWGKHTVKMCGIDAKNLYEEIEDVLIEALKFVYTKRHAKTYVNLNQQTHLFNKE